MSKRLRARILGWWGKGKNVWEISQLTGASEAEVWETINRIEGAKVTPTVCRCGGCKVLRTLYGGDYTTAHDEQLGRADDPGLANDSGIALVDVLLAVDIVCILAAIGQVIRWLAM